MTDINQLLERLQKQQDAIGSAIMVIKAFSSEQALPPGLQVNSIIDQAHTLTTTAIHENWIAVNGAAVNGVKKKKPPMTPELKAIISAKTKAAWAARKKAAAELAAAVATATEAKAAKKKAAKKAIAA